MERTAAVRVPRFRLTVELLRLGRLPGGERQSLVFCDAFSTP